ncbi:putative glutathione S-transferase [Phytophthora sojae]|uniref:Glutathione S-transferase n=1 Tax=Phytophthora sojae (strain P6497) TaxID=1094619 RepID=G4Z6I0_PHYSP|nr:putative glutathione S-transferase [Phytophthora sojae]EGZ19550.1 putative glutathione S-transferase [Phytophthora sojae]|eukprot:XP_009522267.1 putative glutathione S-transferase [Phytophthora sojae]
MIQPKIKLTYFDGKGYAELARMLFNYGNVAFMDERISLEDYEAMKPKLPFVQVPILEVDGTVYSQSMAMARYAAKLAGLYPGDAVTALKVDMFSSSLCDLDAPFMDFMWKTEDETEKAEKKKVFIEETVPTFLTTFEKLVAGKFVLGDTISYADLQLSVFPDFSVDGYPKLAATVSNVKTEPTIAAYLSLAEQSAQGLRK